MAFAEALLCAAGGLRAGSQCKSHPQSKWDGDSGPGSQDWGGFCAQPGLKVPYGCPTQGPPRAGAGTGERSLCPSHGPSPPGRHPPPVGPSPSLGSPSSPHSPQMLLQFLQNICFLASGPWCMLFPHPSPLPCAPRQAGLSHSDPPSGLSSPVPPPGKPWLRVLSRTGSLEEAPCSARGVGGPSFQQASLGYKLHPDSSPCLALASPTSPTEDSGVVDTPSPPTRTHKFVSRQQKRQVGRGLHYKPPSIDEDIGLGQARRPEGQSHQA